MPDQIELVLIEESVLAELISVAQDNIERVEDEWGRGLSWESMLRNGDKEALLVEKARQSLSPARSSEGSSDA